MEQVPKQLKTGFNMIESNTMDEQENEMLLTVVSTMSILMEKAIESAELYTKHANREIILGNDIIIALQFQAHVFFNLPGVKEDCLALKEEMRNELEEESEDESDYESDDESDADECWTKSECECGRCKAMNKFHEEWDLWQPTDEFQCSIKRAIDKAISEYS